MMIALPNGTLCATMKVSNVQGHYLIHSSKNKTHTQQQQQQKQWVMNQDNTHCIKNQSKAFSR